MIFFVKREREIGRMRRASKIVAGILELMREIVVPGVTTGYLNERAENFIAKEGGLPSFKGYRPGKGFTPYPAAICTSINDQVVHGIPDYERFLVEGEIVSIDVGVIYEGYHGDAAYTYPVGHVSQLMISLMQAGREALKAAMKEAYPGKTTGDIGFVTENVAVKNGFSVVKSYAGHGVGKKLHEPPQIPNYGVRGSGVVLKQGMTIAVEPMVNAGGSDVETLNDGWTVVTVDRQPSAHYEHTLLLTKDGPDILTEHGCDL